jgi:periplasmic divalent cation tolerance protein
MVVLCTAPDANVAARLARGLVEAKLAACVNVISGLKSFYVWKGELQEDAEVQLVIKSRREHLAALEAWIAEHHPYDVPEVLCLAVDGGSKAYLDWLYQQTSLD